MTRFIDATPAQRWFQYTKPDLEKRLAAMPAVRADHKARFLAARDARDANPGSAKHSRRFTALIKELYQIGDSEVALIETLRTGAQRYEGA